MIEFPGVLKLETMRKGWPYSKLPVHELELENCPNLVIPAKLKVRDKITITSGPICVEVVFDGAVLVTISGANIPHILADQKVGKPLSDLIDIGQLRNHPVSGMTISTIEVLENGVDIELTP